LKSVAQQNQPGQTTQDQSGNHILSLAILQTPSLGQAYEVFQLASAADLQALEISPLGTKGHLIIEGRKKDLFEFLIQVKSEIFSKDDESDIQNEAAPQNQLNIKLCEVDTEIMETYLSIRQGTLKDHLLIVEGPFLGDLFEVSMQLKKEGFIVLDLRSPKTEPSHCFGFFSITNENWTLDLQLKLKGIFAEQLKWKVIENPHPDLRSYFEL